MQLLQFQRQCIQIYLIHSSIILNSVRSIGRCGQEYIYQLSLVEQLHFLLEKGHMTSDIHALGTTHLDYCLVL